MSKLFRMITAFSRAKPDFIIVGAQKSGTTSLYEYLIQHPKIHGVSKKEIHYFDTYAHRPHSYYKSFFPLKSQVKKDEICGEASTGYLLNPLVPKRIHDYNPKTKIIALLRDPVARAISSYHHQIRKGTEKNEIDKAFDIEDERLKEHWQKVLKAQGDVKFSSKQVRQFSYKKRGLYLDQLKKYYEVFDKDQIFVEYSENFFKDPENTLKRLFEFLDVDSNFVPADLKPKNVKEYDESDKEIVEKLKIYFEKPNKELFEFLERKAPW